MKEYMELLQDYLSIVNPFWHIEFNNDFEIYTATNELLYHGTRMECIAYLKGYRRLQEELTGAIYNDENNN